MWALAIALFVFLILNYIYWKVSHGYAEKGFGKKTFNKWGTRTYYWQVGLLLSGAITVAIIFLLKWANVLTF